MVQKAFMFAILLLLWLRYGRVWSKPGQPVAVWSKPRLSGATSAARFARFIRRRLGAARNHAFSVEPPLTGWPPQHVFADPAADARPEICVTMRWLRAAQGLRGLLLVASSCEFDVQQFVFVFCFFS